MHIFSSAKASQNKLHFIKISLLTYFRSDITKISISILRMTTSFVRNPFDK